MQFHEYHPVVLLCYPYILFLLLLIITLDHLSVFKDVSSILAVTGMSWECLDILDT